MAASEKRAYLGKEERKEQLVQAGADLVEQQGWGALNMSTLAEFSGVSRQLVYQHFPNLASLYSSVAWVIFMDTMEDTQQAIAQHPDNILQAIPAAAKATLEMSDGRGDALWQVIAGLHMNIPELEALRFGIRNVILDLWQSVGEKQTGLPPEEARTLIWMLIMSFWGVRNLVRDGVMRREEGIAQFERYARTVLEGKLN